ncbi:ABC transporter ATP-binding protein [Pendulispora albinea]|uniref:ABC transporter ATP-binding protein n=1 Tax=Pendulispora albinea TaxID=2741071 RepID=A0ABZ2LZJ2_9BACT
MIAPLVRTRGLSKTFGDEGELTHVLRSVDFELRPGELVLFMGPSGSGKTTFISIVVGVMRASGGRVELCGADITDVSQESAAALRRRKLGFVFQTDNLFPGLTAHGNVAEVLRMKGCSHVQERATEALEAVGLGHRLHHLPGQLSGGQRQRVSIARALASDPALLVGDEITAALDGEMAMRVMDVVRARTSSGRGALIVTHDERLLQYADRVVHMEDGRIRSDLSRRSARGVITGAP